MPQDTQKKLIAIDGNSLMHRAYYALPATMTSREGVPTNALHGFMAMLIKLLEQKPDYLVVAFDMHGPTFRHDSYGEYKAGRRETPEDLRPQFPLLQELLHHMGIAVCTLERYEADDILGAFARKAEAHGVNALLVTGDRDALQLISETTHILITKKGISETADMDIAALKEAYGLSPGQMRDLKGLMGDTSDNIPGIPGVGEKTALKLLHEYGSMEAVLENAANIKGKLGEKVRANADLARMSYALGVIDTNAPITMELQDTAFDESRMQNALPLLRKLNLNSIAARLPEGVMEKKTSTPAQEIHAVALSDIDELTGLAHTLLNAEQIAFHADGDTLSLCAGGALYSVRLFGTLLEPGLAQSEALAALKPVFEAQSIKKIVFDAKKWMHILANEGIALNNLHFDAMIADYLLHATRPAASLDALVQERLSQKTGNAALLLSLYFPMRLMLKEQGLAPLYEEVELPLVRVLYDMERIGFNLDKETLHALKEQFSVRIDALAEEIYTHADERFNILSTKQLGAVLFEKLQLPTQKKIKTGYSTDADVLERLVNLHPIVGLVQEYRFLTKLKSTFVDGLISMISVTDGRVHTSFNQNITATGRISSTEPNLQNIPVRTPLGREIRKAFIASEGNILIGADYSQIELRLLAHISQDAAMLASFCEDGDIHTRTASEVFNIPVSQISADQRSAAKAVNFGIVYGISDFGLSKNLNIPRKQAAEYIERYLDRYPGVRAYMRESVARGKEDGYVATLLGRRRELPELKSANYNTRSFGERVALNMPIQGSAADIIKLAMVRVHKALLERGMKTRLILQVHDELILDAPPDEEAEASALLCDCMQNAMQLDVPLIADVRSGRSWYDTK